MLSRLHRDFIAGLIRKSGFELHRAGRYPLGRSPFRDIAYILGDTQDPCIFDVGANIGQTLEDILRFWKDARVHCFEPGPRAFAQLQDRAEGHPNVKISRCAVGSEVGERIFKERKGSALSSFLESGSEFDSPPVSSYPVCIDTIDAYCARESIDHVDVLKTDTQGFDLEVMKGGGSMIGQGKIGMILVEITFAGYYDGQASAGQLIDYLTDHEFLPVCFYPMIYFKGHGHWIDGLFLHRARTIPG